MSSSLPPQALLPVATPAPLQAAPRRPTLRFMLSHPAHWIAYGFGCGLSPLTPGTVATLWAWLAFVVLQPWIDPLGWVGVLAASTLVGWWACTLTARHMGVADPASIVWDEVLAFWLVLTLVMPAGLAEQCAAFVLFRFFDVVKPGPVGWADGLWKPSRTNDGRILVGWTQGFGILFDDLVAALCTLLAIALWRLA